MKVVGIFTVKNESDPYWFSHFSVYNDSLFMDYSLLTRDFVKKESRELKTSQWFFALDYHSITLKNITRIIFLVDRYARLAKGYHVSLDVAFKPVLERYTVRAKILQTTLLFLQAPTLCMLFIFIYMISFNIVENEKNEIAVFKSRGACNRQVILIYVVESLILSAAAFIFGPPLGIFICRIIGSSNGFLEFIQREALPVSLDIKAYFYALGGILFFGVTMLIPVLISSRTTIVEYKKNIIRSKSVSIFKKSFDIILIIISLYGLYRYYDRQKVLSITGIEGSSLPLDPLLFLVSVFFMLGMGLFFLRIFPYIINCIFLLGRKKWPPVLYASLIHVGRSSRQGHILMIFLILSLSLGIYNSMAARTVNMNIEEKIRYMNGADITIDAEWQTVSFSLGGDSGSSDTPYSTGSGKFEASTGTNILYIEPDFRPYTELQGIEKATKVLKKSRVTAVMPDGVGTVVQLMGIIPHEFGEVAWFRSDLLPYHWYEYLNLLSENPNTLLLSESLRDRYNVNEGDQILLAWSNQGYMEGYAYGFVDYWPSFNPNPIRPGEKTPDLIIANLQYIQTKMFIEPYQVWLKKNNNVTSREIFESIESKQMQISSLRNASKQIIEKKNNSPPNS